MASLQLVGSIDSILDDVLYRMKLFCASFTKQSERCKLFKPGDIVIFKVDDESGCRPEYSVVKTVGDGVIISKSGKKQLVSPSELFTVEEYKKYQRELGNNIVNLFR
jgi:hypothetical protein